MAGSAEGPTTTRWPPAGVSPAGSVAAPPPHRNGTKAASAGGESTARPSLPASGPAQAASASAASPAAPAAPRSARINAVIAVPPRTTDQRITAGAAGENPRRPGAPGGGAGWTYTGSRGRGAERSAPARRRRGAERGGRAAFGAA